MREVQERSARAEFDQIHHTHTSKHYKNYSVYIFSLSIHRLMDDEADSSPLV